MPGLHHARHQGPHTGTQGPGCRLLPRTPVAGQLVSGDEENPRPIIGIKSPASVSINLSQSTIVFSNIMVSDSSDEESSPGSNTCNENSACDRSDNQSTILFSPRMISDTDEDDDATDDEHLMSIKSNESPACDGSDNQSTILFSLSMVGGTDEGASSDNDASGSESPRSIKNNKTSGFDASDNQFTILFSNSMIVGTDNGASDDKRLQSITSNESPVSISNQSASLFSDSLVFGSDNESLSSITSNESFASISNQSTVLFNDTNIDDMLPKESNVNCQKVMNATCVISTKNVNDLDVASIDVRKDELMSDVMKMDGNTFVVGKVQNETLLLVDEIMKNKLVSNDVMNEFGETFVVGEAQNKTLLYTDDMKNDPHFNDRRKIINETFLLSKGPNRNLLLTGAMKKELVFDDRRKYFDETFLVAEAQNMTLRNSEAACNDEMNELDETFIVSGIHNETFQIAKVDDYMKRDRPIDRRVKDVKAKRNKKENGNKNTRVEYKHNINVEEEKDDKKREEVKHMRCLRSARNSQKNTEVAGTSNYVKEDNGNIRKMEKIKESAQHVETRGARPKEWRVRTVQTKSSTDDEVEPLVHISRGRKCKARAIAAISAMLK